MQAVGRLFSSFHEKKQLIFLFTCVFILKTQKLVKINCFLMVANENIGCYYHEMLKKVSQVLALYTTVVIFVNQLFMMFAINYSSHTISLSSANIILFLFRPLFGKNGLMVFQNGFLLSEIILTLISLKYFFLVWRSNLTQKLLCFL